MYNKNYFKEIKTINKTQNYIFGNFKEDFSKEVNNKYQVRFIYDCIFTQIFNIIIIIYSYYYKNYQYCNNCINLLDYKNSHCFKCSNELIFKGLRIKSSLFTLNKIINNNSSISRIGDGEFILIFGKNIGFQKYNQTLAKRLIEVLNSNEKNLLIGINIPYKEKDLKVFKKYIINYYKKFFKKYKFKIIKILNKQKIYYSALITRFYIDYNNNKNIKKYIEKLKKIWDKKNVLIIEGEETRLGIGNDLFNNIKSIKRIICPKKNSFSVYDKIIKETLKVIEKRLILIALGPTATILAYDLYKLGYQVIDVGHIDIEYEWYLRKSKKRIRIEYKFVNEAKNGGKNIKKIKDVNYYKQIIAIIKQ